jgi:hypothetical protein
MVVESCRPASRCPSLVGTHRGHLPSVTRSSRGMSVGSSQQHSTGSAAPSASSIAIRHRATVLLPAVLVRLGVVTLTALVLLRPTREQGGFVPDTSEVPGPRSATGAVPEPPHTGKSDRQERHT